MPSRLITIATFTFQHELLALKGRLEAERIPVFVANDIITQVHPFYSGAVGGIKLQVPEQFLGDALAIMEEAGYPIDLDEESDWVNQQMIRLQHLPFLKSIPQEWRLAAMIILLCLLIIILITVVLMIVG